MRDFDPCRSLRDPSSDREAAREAFAEAAAAYTRATRPIRCPWNPFPADSPWGRQIDEGYRREIAGEHIARRLAPCRFGSHAFVPSASGSASA